MAQIISRIWKPFSGGSVTDAGVSVAILRAKIRLEETRSRARETASTLDAVVSDARDDILQLSYL